MILLRMIIRGPCYINFHILVQIYTHIVTYAMKWFCGTNIYTVETFLQGVYKSNIDVAMKSDLGKKISTHNQKNSTAVLHNSFKTLTITGTSFYSKLLWLF